MPPKLFPNKRPRRPKSRRAGIASESNRDVTEFLQQSTAAPRGSTQVDVKANVQITGGNPDAKVATTRRKIDDRNYVIDIVVDQLGNPSFKSRQAL